MTISCKVCAFVHKLALLAATLVIFYSLTSFRLGCVSESYGLLVNLRACPRGFPASFREKIYSKPVDSLTKVAKLVDFLRLVWLLNWLVGLF